MKPPGAYSIRFAEEPESRHEKVFDPVFSVIALNSYFGFRIFFLQHDDTGIPKNIIQNCFNRFFDWL